MSFIYCQCYLAGVTGPCRAGFKRYYYDSSSKECKQFTYGGCQGNGHIFKNKRFCHYICRVCHDYKSVDIHVNFVNEYRTVFIFKKMLKAPGSLISLLESEWCSCLEDLNSTSVSIAKKSLEYLLLCLNICNVRSNGFVAVL